jgi:hypothetical protein
MRHTFYGVGLICTAFLGCTRVRADQTTVKPSDMSAAAHDEAATKEEQEAKAHLDQAQLSNGPDELQLCNYGGAVIEFPCWTQSTDMVEYNLWQAKQHQRLAQEHSAAAVALRDAENRACQNVPTEDREISPFYHRADILTVRAAVSADDSSTLIGADVVFRAVPGMTHENLQEIIDCEMARNAALGYEESWMPQDPLMLRDISATVDNTEGGLVVNLRAKDPKTAKELAERALLLTKDKK